MPFISESITNPQVIRNTATAQSAHHVQIRPLSLPVVPKIPGPTHRGIEMRTTFMPADYRNAAEAIRQFAVRSDDVWVLGYPGSGAQAVQLLAAQMLQQARGSKNGGEGVGGEQAPLLEQSTIHPRLQRATQRASWERLQRLSTDRPRIICSNLPYHLLPVALWRQQPRIVYVSRDPRRVAAHYYRDYRLLHGYKSSAVEFTQLWHSGQLAYGRLAEHAADFDTLQQLGVPNVCNVKLDEESAEAVELLVRTLADLLQIDVGDATSAQLAQWLQAELAEGGQQLLADVAIMDRHFKRPRTVDCSVVNFNDL